MVEKKQLLRDVAIVEGVSMIPDIIKELKECGYDRLDDVDKVTKNYVKLTESGLFEGLFKDLVQYVVLTLLDYQAGVEESDVQPWVSSKVYEMLSSLDKSKSEVD